MPNMLSTVDVPLVVASQQDKNALLGKTSEEQWNTVELVSPCYDDTSLFERPIWIDHA